MCDVLKIPRSTYYYEEGKVEATAEDEISSIVVDIFQTSRQNYGTRKIKKALHQQGFTVSRRRIGRIMKEYGLVSSYTVAQYKPHSTRCNEAKQAKVYANIIGVNSNAYINPRTARLFFLLLSVDRIHHARN